MQVRVSISDFNANVASPNINKGEHESGEVLTPPLPADHQTPLGHVIQKPGHTFG